ncbi:type 1 fimbrial protein [Citrobacter freundii]|uniref:Type 1 fimbrial protein n=1 Tax=Citrobacter portucalensis TaxID=1639133 RepID=A0A9X4GHK3_9ENTR|nr:MULTISPECIES: fimbrial protein [Citrobacter freundii complex]MDE9617651.1 type 1 fimbrial protein [Citrobacter portucalensis]QLR79006.1 type 1 fimbrial protein [Citrobacter freundii]
MNKKLLAMLMAGGLVAAVNTSAFAGDTGTVEFSGRIVADTCVINVDSTGNNTSVVTFADAYPADFGSDGAIGPTKDFKIELAKCDPAVANLNLMFTGDTTDGTNLRLKNDMTGDGMATNVAITVTNNNGGTNSVVFDGSVPDKSTDVANTGEETTPSVFNYTAKVIQVGTTAPTAGKYHSSANFTVFYR